MIEAIISGIGFGLVLTFITGPVFFALIKTSIEKGFHAGVALALGVVCSDVVFVGGILFGSQYVDISDHTKIIAGIGGAVILFTVGVYYMFKKAEINYGNKVPSGIDKAGYFFKGFLMCIFNPSLLIHWTVVIGAASTTFHVGAPHRSLHIAIMFLTILIVQFSMDTIKAFYADKLRDKISVKLIHRLNEVAGIALIIASLVLIDKLVTHFIFSAPVAS
ncbi:Threonine/homoserine/homoserine lactone efflux protein [Mucilaginibacter pineti]|uniref:Threonine/homoserine/homoserine lactone efflux protein n=1 Tax=Mucilaginibacter pineti TaxID=1391627 RepID=A0A1G7BS73_9SPHI|nr:LysE family transporter [Mucilaginibacter pineti]SDE29991.1 Threonine/homoserine/homoserine lactone efflux protein [Mucilaginibacter pineti]